MDGNELNAQQEAHAMTAREIESQTNALLVVVREAKSKQDETALRQAVSGICELNEPLCHWAVRRRANIDENHDGYEDALQEARVALARAAVWYDATAGIKFSTYAGTAMIHATSRWLMTYLRWGFGHVGDTPKARSGAKRATPPASLDMTHQDNNDCLIVIQEKDLDPPDPLKIWTFAERELSEREFRILRGRLLDNMSLPKLSAEVGVSKERVRQIQRSALYLLRTTIAQRYPEYEPC